jgi:endonuclease/exonuclease/phosphatase family metal-dependent hydrolase
VDRVIAEIDRYKPDIVLLQELVANVDEVHKQLRARYSTVKQSSQPQFTVATRFRIVSIFEPPAIQHDDRQRSPRFLQLKVETPLGLLAVYNVHPVSPRSGFYELRSGGFKRGLLSGELLAGEKADVLLEDARLRALQIQAMGKHARGETLPVVIAGDLNLPGLSPVFARELSQFQDGFRKAGWGFGYTFPKHKIPWMRIDRVLASEQLRFVSFQVGQDTASDHAAVVADLQLRR